MRSSPGKRSTSNIVIIENQENATPKAGSSGDLVPIRGSGVSSKSTNFTSNGLIASSLTRNSQKTISSNADLDFNLEGGVPLEAIQDKTKNPLSKVLLARLDYRPKYSYNYMQKNNLNRNIDNNPINDVDSDYDGGASEVTNTSAINSIGPAPELPVEAREEDGTKEKDGGDKLGKSHSNNIEANEMKPANNGEEAAKDDSPPNTSRTKDPEANCLLNRESNKGNDREGPDEKQVAADPNTADSRNIKSDNNKTIHRNNHTNVLNKKPLFYDFISSFLLLLGGFQCETAEQIFVVEQFFFKGYLPLPLLSIAILLPSIASAVAAIPSMMMVLRSYAEGAATSANSSSTSMLSSAVNVRTTLIWSIVMTALFIFILSLGALYQWRLQREGYELLDSFYEYNSYISYANTNGSFYGAADALKKKNRQRSGSRRGFFHTKGGTGDGGSFSKKTNAYPNRLIIAEAPMGLVPIAVKLERITLAIVVLGALASIIIVPVAHKTSWLGGKFFHDDGDEDGVHPGSALSAGDAPVNLLFLSLPLSLSIICSRLRIRVLLPILLLSILIAYAIAALESVGKGHAFEHVRTMYNNSVKLINDNFTEPNISKRTLSTNHIVYRPQNLFYGFILTIDYSLFSLIIASTMLVMASLREVSARSSIRRVAHVARSMRKMSRLACRTLWLEKDTIHEEIIYRMHRSKPLNDSAKEVSVVCVDLAYSVDRLIVEMGDRRGVRVLMELVREMDRKAMANKIHRTAVTGDMYLGICGLLDQSVATVHALKATSFALAVLHWHPYHGVTLRAGLHSDPLACAIVESRAQLDFVGAGLGIAWELAQHAKPGFATATENFVNYLSRQIGHTVHHYDANSFTRVMLQCTNLPIKMTTLEPGILGSVSPLIEVLNPQRGGTARVSQGASACDTLPYQIFFQELRISYQSNLMQEPWFRSLRQEVGLREPEKEEYQMQMTSELSVRSRLIIKEAVKKLVHHSIRSKRIVAMLGMTLLLVCLISLILYRDVPQRPIGVIVLCVASLCLEFSALISVLVSSIRNSCLASTALCTVSAVLGLLGLYFSAPSTVRGNALHLILALLLLWPHMVQIRPLIWSIGLYTAILVLSVIVMGLILAEVGLSDDLMPATDFTTLALLTPTNCRYHPAIILVYVVPCVLVPTALIVWIEAFGNIHAKSVEISVLVYCSTAVLNTCSTLRNLLDLAIPRHLEQLMLGSYRLGAIKRPFVLVKNDATPYFAFSPSIRRAPRTLRDCPTTDSSYYYCSDSSSSDDDVTGFLVRENDARSARSERRAAKKDAAKDFSELDKGASPMPDSSSDELLPMRPPRSLPQFLVYRWPQMAIGAFFIKDYVPTTSVMTGQVLATHLFQKINIVHESFRAVLQNTINLTIMSFRGDTVVVGGYLGTLRGGAGLVQRVLAAAETSPYYHSITQGGKQRSRSDPKKSQASLRNGSATQDEIDMRRDASEYSMALADAQLPLVNVSVPPENVRGAVFELVYLIRQWFMLQRDKAGTLYAGLNVGPVCGAMLGGLLSFNLVGPTVTTALRIARQAPKDRPMASQLFVTAYESAYRLYLQHHGSTAKVGNGIKPQSIDCGTAVVLNENYRPEGTRPIMALELYIRAKPSKK